MRRHFENAFAIMLLVAVAGCSQGLGEAQMASLMNDHLGREGQGTYISVVNLRKINAHTSADSKYVADVEYDVFFTKGLDEIEDILIRDAKDNVLAGINTSMQMLMLKTRFGNFQAGFSFPTTNTVTFVKGEKGWMVEKIGS